MAGTDMIPQDADSWTLRGMMCSSSTKMTQETVGNNKLQANKCGTEGDVTSNQKFGYAHPKTCFSRQNC